MPVTPVLISADPFAEKEVSLWTRGTWPASWIAPSAEISPPFVVAFRKTFSLETAAKFRAHVAGDERYELFLDGEKIGRGSERGDGANWFFDSYDFEIEAGDHVLVARVWALGAAAAYAQMSVHHGFLFCPQDEEFQKFLGTGASQWQVKVLGGFHFLSPLCAWGTGLNLEIHGEEYSWGFENFPSPGDTENWQTAVVAQTASCRARIELPRTHALRPAILPPQLDEKKHLGLVRHVAELKNEGEIYTCEIPIRAADKLESEQRAWQELMSGASTLVVPPNTRRRVLLDLGNYFCAYPEVVTSGGKGGAVRVHWQEALYETAELGEDDRQAKGNRDEIEGKFFVTLAQRKDGVGDLFLPDGGKQRPWSTLWWQCGRYVEIVVSTQDEALTIENFAFRETRYPLKMESIFESSDARLQNVIPIMVRALQMCAHETYMDCPFYEQLQYIGDTRLEVLVTYAMTRDDRLPRKALELFDASRLPEGLTQSRYPSHVRQVIPPFSLWWIGMVHDFALWRDDKDFVKKMMPGVRAVLDAFRSYQNDEGLIEAPAGWNFCDWVPAWKNGWAPDADKGVSGVLNWQCALIAKQASELENWLGEEEMSNRHHRFASEIAGAASPRFWNETRGLFADDLQHEFFSEHTQCLALLSGLISGEQKEKIARGLCEDENLSHTTIYFSHYLFETLHEIGRVDKFFERMELWFDLPSHGFKTTFEEADWNTSRSDCHAWGAHPLFHYFATIAGVRPASFGFKNIQIKPQMGDLKWLNATLPHPRGQIKVSLQQEAGVLNAQIELPEGVEGELAWSTQAAALRAGRSEVSVGQRAGG